MFGMFFLCSMVSLAAEDVISPDPSVMTELEPEVTLPSVADLMQAYVDENGGHVNIQSMTSLIASGTVIVAQDVRYDFKLYRKRPNLMRIQVDLLSKMMTTISDGSRVFRQISRGDQTLELRELVGEEAAFVRSDSRMDGPFYYLRSRPEFLEVVAEVEVNGTPAYEVAVHENADSVYDRIWISQENYQELKLSRKIEVEGQGTVLEETYYSDFDRVRGVWIAKTIHYYRDGAFFQSVLIDSAKANVGIFDTYFSKPTI
jgi:outer membrane lipoprotein-sorting protein